MPQRPVDEQSAITSLKEKHEARLMAMDGVEGIGIGRNPIGDPALIVYVRDQATARKIPRELEGIAILIQVTGQIDVQPG